ncbi:MAG: MCE family protein [Calditrichaeota bacterium]|nr:MCE family protein [Calditrichota bacterium]
MKSSKESLFSHEVRVGLAVLIGVLIIVVAIMTVGGQQGFLADRYRLRVLMTRVEGLQTGAPVRLAGVRVGTVTSVKFSPDLTENRIVIELEIDAKVKDRIRKDSIAHIGTLGLLGDKYVGITMGSLDQPRLEDGDYLLAAEPLDVEKLIDEGVAAFNLLKRSLSTVDDIVTKINTGKGTLGLLVNDPSMYVDVKALVRVSSAILTYIRSGEGTAARLLADPQLYTRITAFLASGEALVDSVRHGKGTAARFVQDPALYQELMTLARNLNAIAGRLEKGEGSLGLMMNNDLLYRRLNTLAASLDSLVTDLKLNPRRYLKVEIF